MAGYEKPAHPRRPILPIPSNRQCLVAESVQVLTEMLKPMKYLIQIQNKI